MPHQGRTGREDYSANAIVPQWSSKYCPAAASGESVVPRHESIYNHSIKIQVRRHREVTNLNSTQDKNIICLLVQVVGFFARHRSPVCSFLREVCRKDNEYSYEVHISSVR